MVPTSNWVRCVACNGSGRYDHNGSPACAACSGKGKVLQKPKQAPLKVYTLSQCREALSLRRGVKGGQVYFNGLNIGLWMPAGPDAAEFSCRLYKPVGLKLRNSTLRGLESDIAERIFNLAKQTGWGWVQAGR